MTSPWFLIEPIMKKGYDIIYECMAAKYYNGKKKESLFFFFLFFVSPKWYEACEKTGLGGSYTRINWM